MLVFQVLSQSMETGAPPRRKPRRLHRQWMSVIRFILAVNAAGGFFAILAILKGPYDIVFILLPVFMYIAVTQFQRYRLRLPLFMFNMFNIFTSNTPAYLLLTACLALVYYSLLTGIELLIHYPNPSVSRLILITTAFAWTIMLDPVRAYVQKGIDQRFNLRNREAARAIEAFTTTLHEEIDLDQLRERFLTLIQQTMQPYAVSLWTRLSGPQQARSDTLEEMTIAEDDPLLAYVLRHPAPLEIDRLQLDSPLLANLKLHAEIILPLTNQGELFGLLILGSRLKGEAYTPDELNMLNTLAPQVAPALRVAQLVLEQQTQVRERERIEQELRTAQSIQRTFLPREVPTLPGWHIAPYYQPAREVGGDFYDVLPLNDGRLSLVIGDVTGKGVPAALVMATVHTLLRSTMQEIRSPGAILARVNDLLTAEIPTGMFVTCFFALLDPASGQLHYANAGHELPYCQTGGNVAELWATGVPLGMMPDMCYEEHTVTIQPGERLLFYSDGLVEAHNPNREMFSFPRLRQVLTEHAEQPSLIDIVLDELHRFTGEGWEQEDDVTMLTLQRTPGPPHAEPE